MLAVAALARATASHAYAYGARRLGAPAAGAARAVSSRACARSREADGAAGANNEHAGEALAARLRAVAAATPDRVAVVTPGGEEVTFGSLLAHAERVAGSLRAAATASRRTEDGGIEKSGMDHPDAGGAGGVETSADVDADVLRGARVAVSAVPGAEFIAAVHAAWLCGAIAVPIARGHSKDDAASCAPTTWGVTAARSGTRSPTWDESFGIPVSEFAAASLAHEFVVVSIFNVCPGRRHLVCEGPAGGVQPGDAVVEINRRRLHGRPLDLARRRCLRHQRFQELARLLVVPPLHVANLP